MGVWLSGKRAWLGVLFLSLSMVLGGLYAPGVMAQQEPSPIAVEWVAPAEAGPGSVVEVLIQYDAVDLNAGADLNYNVFGPAHILRREPEPPNPLVNTWYPGEGMPAQGTIKVEIQIHQDALGQTIEHQVEVRWGIKAQVFGARTTVKAVPPTAVPTARPQPRPTTQSPATPTLTPSPVPAVKPVVTLDSVTLVDDEGRALAEAAANQDVALEATYSSSAEMRDVQVEIRFEPPVVELEGLEARDGIYVVDLPVLAAAQEASLFESAQGRVRSFSDGGDEYALRAFVRIVPAEGTVDEELPEVASEPVLVSQSLALSVRASVDATEVRAGESFVVHVVCENQGTMPARQVRIKLAGLPEGYTASPDVQVIEQVAAEGGTEQRLITVRTVEGYDGPVEARVVASVGDLTILADPVTLESKASIPLRLEASSSSPAVYAGEAAYIRVVAENAGSFPAKGVTARLIDVTGNLGVLVQDVGEIAAGASDEWVFVVDIPVDFPSDVESTFVAQTVSADGLTSESGPVSLSVACRPRLEVYVEPPTGRIVGGQALETIVLVKNVGPCVAREVVVGLEGLPGEFALPPAQEVVELPAGGMRYLTFNLLVPQAFRGEADYYGRAQESTGGQSQSEPVWFIVGGMPVVWSIVLGFLAVLAIVAIIVGMVLYVRVR